MSTCVTADHTQSLAHTRQTLPQRVPALALCRLTHLSPAHRVQFVINHQYISIIVTFNMSSQTNKTSASPRNAFTRHCGCTAFWVKRTALSGPLPALFAVSLEQTWLEESSVPCRRSFSDVDSTQGSARWRACCVRAEQFLFL